MYVKPSGSESDMHFWCFYTVCPPFWREHRGFSERQIARFRCPLNNKREKSGKRGFFVFSKISEGQKGFTALPRALRCKSQKVTMFYFSSNKWRRGHSALGLWVKWTSEKGSSLSWKCPTFEAFVKNVYRATLFSAGQFGLGQENKEIDC